MMVQAMNGIVDVNAIDSLAHALNDPSTVGGWTHNFYRYPARLSPALARWIIETFTEPGDVVFDPFVGGGTTLVEATAAGRRALGVDINSLAVFVSRVKTQPLSKAQIARLRSWSDDLPSRLNLERSVIRDPWWTSHGYHRNTTGRSCWPIRKSIELFLQDLPSLRTKKEQDFARCVLLKTAQWALDAKEGVPKAGEFRAMLRSTFMEMLEDVQAYGEEIENWSDASSCEETPSSKCLHRSVIGLENERRLTKVLPPRLVLTSPPYPGVHILYHRWQVAGRKETPLPFFIAGCLDGEGAAHYTFGDRKSHLKEKYFDQLEKTFSSICQVIDETTIVAQIVGFSSPESQLPRYLDTLQKVGLEEFRIGDYSKSSDGRPWRQVPNRKWYVRCGSVAAAASEVVLFHCKKAVSRE